MDHLGSLLSWIETPHGENGVHTLGERRQWREPWHTISYRDLAAEVRTLAAGLRSYGVTPGDRVCVLCPPGPAFISALYAVWWSGGCVVSLPLPAMYEPPKRYWPRITAMISAAHPRLILTSTALLAASEPAQSAQTSLAQTRIVTLDEVREAGCGGPTERSRGTDIALIQFTSGSGGPQKAVKITAGNLSANVAAITRWTGMSEADRGVTWLPHYHDMGLIGCTLVPVAAQTDLYTLRPEQFIRDPLAWLGCLGCLGATMTAGPNFGFQYAATRIRPERLRDMDFSRWRIAIVGAERVNPNTLAKFTKLVEPYGFRAQTFMPAYGLAEATLAVTGKRAGDPITALSVDWLSADRARQVPIQSAHQMPDFDAEDARSWAVGCGQPLDGVQVAIVDDDGDPLPEGTLGEVAVSGPSVAQGYLIEQSDSVLTTFTGSRLLTGDDGFIWKEELYLVGRRGDGLKVAGRSLYSEQVELEFCAATGINPGRCTALLGYLASAEFAAVIVEASPGPWLESGATALRRITGGISHAIYTAKRGTIGRTSSGKPIRRDAWRRLVSSDLEATCVYRKD